MVTLDTCLFLSLAVMSVTVQVMAAIQDVQKNGIPAIAKYSSDPEIMAVIEDLKSLF